MKILIILLFSFTLSFAIVPAKTNLDSIENKIASALAYPQNSHTFAFIVGIEEYNSIDPILYSENSARTFALLAKKSFGVKEENIFMLINDEATTTEITKKFTKLTSKLKKGDTVLFYFSGDIFENKKQRNEPYLRSFEFNTAKITAEKELKLSNISKKLSSSKASKVLVFIDASLSEAIKITNKKTTVIVAARAKEPSNFYEKEKHRLFSYFFMRAIADREYRDIDKLFEYVRQNVAKISKELGVSFKQTPKIIGNENMSF